MSHSVGPYFVNYRGKGAEQGMDPDPRASCGPHLLQTVYKKGVPYISGSPGNLTLRAAQERGGPNNRTGGFQCESCGINDTPRIPWCILNAAVGHQPSNPKAPLQVFQWTDWAHFSCLPALPRPNPRKTLRAWCVGGALPKYAFLYVLMSVKHYSLSLSIYALLCKRAKDNV